MYTAMTTSPTTPPRNPLPMSQDGSRGEPYHCISSPSELSSCPPPNGLTPVVSSSVVGCCQAEMPRQPTLLERRERKLFNGIFPNLNVETLQGDYQNAVEQEPDSGTIFRSWSATDIGRSLTTSSVNGKIKLVSYNILAQRLVSSERYPHCPPYALAEDYRCSLLEQELRQISPDIIAFQEISVDVFEKPDLLGGWLRSKYRFVGNHLVITDTKGRPMSWDGDAAADTKNVNIPEEEEFVCQHEMHDDTTRVVKPVSNGGEGRQRRSEMEGVGIFYLAERFEPLEVVRIRFNEIAAADESLTERERRALQVGSHNVSLITVLRDRAEPNIIYVICNVHLIWQRTECQLWQIHHVLREMEQLKLRYERHTEDSSDSLPLVSLILAGDFNAEPNAPPVLYALTGVPPPGSDVVNCWRVPDGEGDEDTTTSFVINSDDIKEGVNLERPEVVASSGHCKGGCSTRKRYRITRNVGHGLSLNDSYATYRVRHPCRVSAVNPSTNGEGRVLDHILLDERHVVCTAVLRLSGLAKLPTRNCPSDHYPVGVIITPRILLT